VLGAAESVPVPRSTSTWIFGVDHLVPPRMGLPGLTQVAAIDARQQRHAWVVETSGGRHGVRGEDRSTSMTAPAPSLLEQTGSLPDAVRRSRIPLARPAWRLVLQRSPIPVEPVPGEDPGLVISVYGEQRRLLETVDPATGHVTPSPWK
jgi:hypothetical protein